MYPISVQDGMIHINGSPLGASYYVSLTPEGELYLGVTNTNSIGGITIASGGYLTNGQDGNLNIGNLIICPSGNPTLGEISTGAGGQFSIVGEGDSSVGNLSLGENGDIYIGNTPIGNVSNGIINDDFDLNFLLVFNPNYDDPLHWLNTQCELYNDELYESNQAEMTDLESMEDVDFSLVDTAGFSEEMIGFLTVERMNIRLPIFAGAHDGNMLRGAAHLTQSSLPVGGINTNAVITAHRGLSRARMFRDIEDMQYGDYIYITNFYQTLRYRVIDTLIIDDSNVAALKIWPGRDMITLKTCHPYRHNHQRYLVFAERVLY